MPEYVIDRERSRSVDLVWANIELTAGRGWNALLVSYGRTDDDAFVYDCGIELYTPGIFLSSDFYLDGTETWRADRECSVRSRTQHRKISSEISECASRVSVRFKLDRRVVDWLAVRISNGAVDRYRLLLSRNTNNADRDQDQHERDALSSYTQECR